MGFEIIAILLMVGILGGMHGKERLSASRRHRTWLAGWLDLVARWRLSRHERVATLVYSGERASWNVRIELGAPEIDAIPEALISLWPADEAPDGLRIVRHALPDSLKSTLYPGAEPVGDQAFDALYVLVDAPDLPSIALCHEHVRRVFVELAELEASFEHGGLRAVSRPEPESLTSDAFERASDHLDALAQFVGTSMRDAPHVALRVACFDESPVLRARAAALLGDSRSRWSDTLQLMHQHSDVRMEQLTWLAAQQEYRPWIRQCLHWRGMPSELRSRVLLEDWRTVATHERLEMWRRVLDAGDISALINVVSVYEVLEELLDLRGGWLSAQVSSRALCDLARAIGASPETGRAGESLLLSLLEHGTSSLRLAAIQALERVGGLAALPHLQRLASQGDGSHRHAARSAVRAIIARLGSPEQGRLAIMSARTMPGELAIGGE